MTLTQGHIAKVKVTVYTWQKKIVSGPLLFMDNLDGDYLRHTIVHDPVVLVAGGGVNLFR